MILNPSTPKLFLVVTILWVNTQAARILTVFPIVSKSHFAVGESLSVGLARAGHQVTLVCPFDHKSPVDNLEVVQLTGGIEIAEARIKDYRTIDSLNIPKSLLIPGFIIEGYTISSFVLQHPQMQRLMETRSYDLIIIEIFTSEAIFGLGQHFGAPTIAVSAFGQSTWTNDLVGNPAPLSTVPSTWSDYSTRMSLWQRSGNVLIAAYERMLIHALHHPIQRYVFNKVFPSATASYDEMIANVSMVFLNSHFSVNLPRPYLPNVIEVGGMHIQRTAKPLPAKIQKFLDSATDGAIFFSLGSLVNSTFMSSREIATLCNVFRSLKQKVLWKFEKDLNVASNVMIENWLPQNAILAHPNIKLFISHGGMLSTSEAVYHAVPVLGMPMWADQERNIQCCVTAGWALQFFFANLTEDSFGWAVHEMLSNPSYQTKASQVSKAFRDQPMTPLETAIYWSEYVIRHRGAPHFRSAAMYLNIVQYHNLDVFCILTVLALVIIYVSYLLCKFTCRRCWKSKQTPTKQVISTKKRI